MAFILVSVVKRLTVVRKVIHAVVSNRNINKRNKTKVRSKALLKAFPMRKGIKERNDIKKLLSFYTVQGGKMCVTTFASLTNFSIHTIAHYAHSTVKGLLF